MKERLAKRKERYRTIGPAPAEAGVLRPGARGKWPNLPGGWPKPLLLLTRDHRRPVLRRCSSVGSEAVGLLCAVVAQLVRAPDCGSGGRWFKPTQLYHF